MANSSPRRILLIGILWAACLGIFTIGLQLSMQNFTFGADFYTYWAADKALIIDHLNPYSEPVTQAIQMGKYGRLVNPGEDQVAFANPLYSLFPIFPLTWMSFHWAISFWMAFNILALLTLLFFVFNNRPKIFLISALFFYPIAFGIIIGNFAVPLGTILLFEIYFLILKRKNSLGWQISAGILLAWASIKPQFMLLFIAFFLLYALRQRLWAFLSAFLGTMSLLAILSQILAPTWIPDWYQRLFEYAQYTHGQPTLQILLSTFLDPNRAQLAYWAILAGIGLFSLVLIFAWFRGRLEDLPLLAWIGTVTFLIHVHGNAHEQLTFLMPFFVWAAVSYAKKPRIVTAFWMIAWIYSWIAFALGWISTAFDRSPVLLSSVFVAWLIIQADWPSIWHEVGKTAPFLRKNQKALSRQKEFTP